MLASQLYVCFAKQDQWPRYTSTSLSHSFPGCLKLDVLSLLSFQMLHIAQNQAALDTIFIHASPICCWPWTSSPVTMRPCAVSGQDMHLHLCPTLFQDAWSLTCCHCWKFSDCSYFLHCTHWLLLAVVMLEGISYIQTWLLPPHVLWFVMPAAVPNFP